RRYESASSLAMDIGRHLAGEPVMAAPPSRMYRMEKYLRRHRGQAIAASLVVLSLIAAVAGAATVAGPEARRMRVTERVVDFQGQTLKDIKLPLVGNRLREDILREAEEGWGRRPDLLPEDIAKRREDLHRLLADSNFTKTAINELRQNIFAQI